MGHLVFVESGMSRSSLLMQGKRNLLWFGQCLPLILWVVLLLALNQGQPVAQNLQKQVRRWTVEDGLPSNNITDLTMDSRGYLWVGTTNGLCRFNGKEFELFVDDPAVENRLKGDFVRSTFEDPFHRMYVLIQGGGLCRYDPKVPEKGFEEIIPPSAFPRLQGLGVTSLILNADSSAVYLMYDDTVRVFRFDEKRLLPYDPFANNPDLGGFRIRYTRGLKGTQDRIASWHPDHGVIVYEVATGHIIFQTPPSIRKENQAQPSRIRFNIIDPYLLVFTELGQYWLFDWTRNALIYEGKVPLPPNKKFIKGGPFSDGSFSYSYDGEKIYQYFPALQKGAELKYLRMIEDSTSISYRGHIETKDGSSWICSNQGLLLWSALNNTIGNYEVRIPGHLYTVSPVINTLSGTATHPVLVSTNAGLHIYDENTNSFSVPEFYEDGKSVPTEGFLFCDQEKVFVAKRGIYELDIDHHIAHTMHLKGAPADIEAFENSSKVIVFRDVTGEGMNWWLGVNPGGLFHWNVETQQLRHIPLAGNADQLHTMRIINYDEFGRLFVYCSRTGMYFMDPRTCQIESFIPLDSFPNYGLARQTLMSSTLSPDKTIWMAQQAVGLVKLSFDANRRPHATHFGKERGLNNTIVYVLQSDRAGNIWISSQSGIEKWDVRYERFFHYGPEHGIVESQFRFPTWKDPEGNLFFGSDYKFVVFHPDSLVLNTDPPNVIIKRIQVNAITRSDLLDQEIIRLKPMEKNVVLQFDAIDFKNPTKILFRYKINQKGKPGNPWTTTNHYEVALASLSPGEYELVYNAANEHGFWHNADKRIVIQLPKPWYATLWFFTFCGLAVAGILYSIYRYKMRELRRIMMIRNRISRDLHDDIGSSLGSISIYSEVAKNTAPESRTDVLDKIGDASREILEKLNDIVWSINPENDTLEKMEKRMRSYAAMLLNPLGISFDLKLTTANQAARMDMDDRRHVYLIFKEALHNAAKYAQCKSVSIDIMEEGGKLRMDIRDDGKGFLKEQVAAHNGNGLKSMKSRAEMLGASLTIDSQLGQGTQIHLVQK